MFLQLVAQPRSDVAGTEKATQRMDGCESYLVDNGLGFQKKAAALAVVNSTLSGATAWGKHAKLRGASRRNRLGQAGLDAATTSAATIWHKLVEIGLEGDE